MTDHVDVVVRGIVLTFVVSIAVVFIACIFIAGHLVAENWNETGPYVLGALALCVLVYALGVLDKRRDYLKRLGDRID